MEKIFHVLSFAFINYEFDIIKAISTSYQRSNKLEADKFYIFVPLTPSPILTQTSFYFDTPLPPTRMSHALPYLDDIEPKSTSQHYLNRRVDRTELQVQTIT